MTACKGMRGRTAGRPLGRKHIEVRRRTHRLAPGVIGLSLVMVFAAFVFLIVPSPALASSSAQSGGFSAAENGTGPDYIPGFYLTLNCPHGTINAEAMACDHQSSVIQDICDSPSCQFSLSGTVDPGYTFYGWTSTGVVITCSTSCLTNATLTVYVPNWGGRYAGSVSLNTTPPPTVSVTVATFENWSVKWFPAEVQACLGFGFGCSTASNGQTLTLDLDKVYTLTAVGLGPSMQFYHWTTNAGALSSATTSPTTLNVKSSGTVSLYASTNVTSWAGYIYSPSTSTGKVTSVSAEFTVPARVKSYSYGVWIGIGGLPNTNLFQAGVILPGTNYGGLPEAFWEEVGVSTCTPAEGGCQYTNASMVTTVGDTLLVTVTSNGGLCSFSIKDLTRNNELWTKGSIQWSPYSQSGEWIDEPLAAFTTPLVNITTMMLDGTSVSLLGGFLVEETQSYNVTMLGVLAGYPYFDINPV
jgi:hypothetical protein